MDSNAVEPTRVGLQGLIQYSLALAAPSQWVQKTDQFTDIPSAANAAAIESSLRTNFEADGFPLLPITDLTTEGGPDHSWLGPLSRHIPLEIGNDFTRADGDEFPCLLEWARHNPADSSPNRYLRAERVVDSNERLANDYILGGLETGNSLSQLRWFLVRLYAQRRNMIFASQLAERLYHIWLPPAVLAPTAGEDAERQLALFPVVSLTRRPYAETWRHTSAISLILAPISGVVGEVPEQPQLSLEPAPAIAGSSRPTTSGEVGSLLDSLRGSSFDAPGSSSARYESIAGDLWAYLSAVGVNCETTGAILKSASRAMSSGGKGGNANPTATLREWCELITTAATERLWGWSGMPLVDEVLRSMRVNSIWSVVVAVDHAGARFPSRDGQHSGWVVRDDICEPDVMPPEIDDLLAMLRGSDDHYLPRPTWSRIDDLTSMEGTYMTWNVPGRRGIVTVYDLTRECFPGESSLNLFGFLGHALLGAVHSAATVDALNRVPVQPDKIVPFANKAHLLAGELDEMFDLDIVSAQFQVIWRRLRRALGTDDQYHMARDRLELLTRYSEVIDRNRREERAQNLERFTAYGGAVAAIVGIGILVFSIGLLIKDAWTSATFAITYWCIGIFAASVVLVAIGAVGARRWGWFRSGSAA